MIAETVRQNLLAIANAYARATGASPGAISTAFYGKSSFLRDLESGSHSITPPKLDEVLARFSEKWPVGVKWPETAPIRMSRPRKKSVK